MESKQDLINKYCYIEECINTEKENLIYLLKNSLIEDINLLNIHYRFKDLIFKRESITKRLFDEFDLIIVHEE